MKYFEYREPRQHGTIDFPFAFYDGTPQQPRYQMVPHWHPEFELVRVIEGYFHISLDGQEFIGSAGDIFFITGGVIHSGIPKDCHYQCVVFDLNYFIKQRMGHIQDLLSIAGKTRQVTSYHPASSHSFHIFAYGFFDTLKNQPPGYELTTIGLVYCLLGYIIEANLFDKNTELVRNTQKIELFKSALDFIHYNFSEPITLKMIADQVHMNPNYFCRFFQKYASMTPVQYLNDYRIESACEMILTTDKSITEIAFECGFRDTSYFVKVFKSHTGKTPTEYKRQS